MNWYLCDFEDSFTYNIFSEFTLLGYKVEIIERKKIAEFLERTKNTQERLGIILGPGPGHPKDYGDVITSLKVCLTNQNLYIFGICLGHQLIATAMGFEINKSYKPSHGEAFDLDLSKEAQRVFNLSSRIKIQRYNSLSLKDTKEVAFKLKKSAVNFIPHNGEILALKGKNFLSYQFHPESVGTSFRSQFFRF